jgi:hypothetical protein
MKKNRTFIFLCILAFSSTSFIRPIVHDVDLAEYEVKIMFTGYTTLYGNIDNCDMGNPGQVVLSGILSGNENTGQDDTVLYTGVLNLSIKMSICSVKRQNGEDKWCVMNVTGNGPVNTELELDPSVGYGYIKIQYEPSLGKFERSVNGTCDQTQMIEEQNMVPNETIAAIFNGRELPMLSERTLRKTIYPSDIAPDGETVVEVIRKIH